MNEPRSLPDDAQKSYYDGDYYDKIGFTDTMANEKEYAIRASMAAWVRRDIPRDAKVFEFGCGPGYNLANLSNAEREAFDLSSQAREFVRRKGIRVYDSVEEIPRDHYDVVICSHVLEHTVDPAATLKLFHRLLLKGGRLDLMLPVENFHKIPTRFAPDVNQHLFAWAPCNIIDLLILCGFKVEKVYRVPMFARIVLWGLFGRWPRLAMFLLRLAGWPMPRRRQELRVQARKVDQPPGGPAEAH